LSSNQLALPSVVASERTAAGRIEILLKAKPTDTASRKSVQTMSFDSTPKGKLRQVMEAAVQANGRFDDPNPVLRKISSFDMQNTSAEITALR
jgi:hypothetical protein